VDARLRNHEALLAPEAHLVSYAWLSPRAEFICRRVISSNALHIQRLLDVLRGVFAENASRGNAELAEVLASGRLTLPVTETYKAVPNQRIRRTFSRGGKISFSMKLRVRFAIR